MSGQTDLATLLRTLRPSLRPTTYVFCTIEDAVYGDLADVRPIASIAEGEGLTLVLPQASADHAGLAYEGLFRCITLEVHSSLQAVGLTAAVAGALAKIGVSANMLAGYFHDHVLVPAADVEAAMACLDALTTASPLSA